MSSKNAVLLSAKQPTGAPSQKSRRPTDREIAARAYEIYLLHRASHGSDVEDWLQAERELLERK